jgi:hypothetical protein
MNETKVYRVRKDNFLWKSGAILEFFKSEPYIPGGYRPNEDIWDTSPYNGTEFISPPVVENNPEWFERVYPVEVDHSMVYVPRDKAVEIIKSRYK